MTDLLLLLFLPLHLAMALMVSRILTKISSKQWQNDSASDEGVFIYEDGECFSGSAGDDHHRAAPPTPPVANPKNAVPKNNLKYDSVKRANNWSNIDSQQSKRSVITKALYDSNTIIIQAEKELKCHSLALTCFRRFRREGTLKFELFDGEDGEDYETARMIHKTKIEKGCFELYLERFGLQLEETQYCTPSTPMTIVLKLSTDD